MFASYFPFPYKKQKLVNSFFLHPQSTPKMMSLQSLKGKLHIEAVQTVTPLKVTDPRTSTKLVLKRDLTSNVANTSLHMILFFNKASEDDSGWLHAAWIKESLGWALVERPILAGRLRWCQEDVSALEIVSNDSGVRMVEVKADATMEELLQMPEKREAEAHLVYWEDCPEKNPQFSPLFYVQVTNFSCGAYTVGFSYSLLLMDPFSATSFMKSWAQTHRDVASRRDGSKFPVFYHPLLRTPGASPAALLMESKKGKTAAESLVFTVGHNNSSLDDDAYGNLVEVCMNEAETETGRKMTEHISVLIKPYTGNDAQMVNVVLRSDGGLKFRSDNNSDSVSFARTWNELGLEDICLNEGKKPVYASCWINNSTLDQGSVLVVPDSLETKIVVSFP